MFAGSVGAVQPFNVRSAGKVMLAPLNGLLLMIVIVCTQKFSVPAGSVAA